MPLGMANIVRAGFNPLNKMEQLTRNAVGMVHIIASILQGLQEAWNLENCKYRPCLWHS